MKAAEKSWRQGKPASKGAAASETCFGTGHGTNQWYFSPQISLHLYICPFTTFRSNSFSPLRGLWREQEGLKTREGRSLEFAATLNSGKRVAVYNQRPGDAERSAQLSSPLRARPRLPQPIRRFRRGGDKPPALPNAPAGPGASPSAGPQGISAVFPRPPRPPRALPRPHLPRRPGLSSLARIFLILTGRPLRVDRTRRWRKKLQPA